MIITGSGGLLLIILAVLALTGSYRPAVPTIAGLRVIFRPIHTLDDIQPLDSLKVPPIAYTNTISFAGLNPKNKKEKFFHLLLPAVLISKHKLASQRKKAAALIRKKRRLESEQEWLDLLLKRFRTDDYQELLLRMAGHPTSIVLAQAAMETGWGESRFFTDSNNAFGVWSFKADEPRIKAKKNRQDKTIYLKKYKSLIGSVDDYFLTIARGPYQKFRQTRQLHDDPEKLAQHLGNYSEQRLLYTSRLQEVIKQNNLKRFDAYHLDPAFIAGM